MPAVCPNHPGRAVSQQELGTRSVFVIAKTLRESSFPGTQYPDGSIGWFGWIREHQYCVECIEEHLFVARFGRARMNTSSLFVDNAKTGYRLHYNGKLWSIRSPFTFNALFKAEEEAKLACVDRWRHDVFELTTDERVALERLKTTTTITDPSTVARLRNRGLVTVADSNVYLSRLGRRLVA